MVNVASLQERHRLRPLDSSGWLLGGYLDLYPGVGLAKPRLALGRVRIAAVEVAQAEVEDLGFDVLGARRVDRFTQLLDQELDELGPGAGGSCETPRG